MSETKSKVLNTQLEEVLKHYLVNCSTAQAKARRKTPELEIRFGTNPKVAKPISIVDYQNVVAHLLSCGWTTESLHMKGNQMLRIIPERLQGGPKEENVPKPEERAPEPPQPDEKDNEDEDDDDDEDDPFALPNNTKEGGAPRKTAYDAVPNKRVKMTMSNIRAEIEGVQQIQDYCQHNDLEKIHNKHNVIKFTKKSRVLNPSSGKPFDMIDFEDHNFRVAYMEEEEYRLSSQYMPIKKTLYDWPNAKKTFRCINRVRFSHPKHPIFVDISIVKTNKKVAYRNGKLGPPSPTETIQESGVFHTTPVYEVELELDNDTIKTYNHSSSTIQMLMTHIKQCVRYVLSGLQETPYPVPYSEQVSVIDAYMCRLYSESWMKTQSPKPYFIGPQSVALQLEHIVEPNEETKMSSQISIRKDYTVTEKADGIRALLYVSKTGRVYMINSNLKVLFTGAMTKEKNCWDSLLDGEFIMYGKAPNKKRLFLYAAFDIYYFGGMQKDAHVRPLPFSTTDETALEDKFRYSLLKKFHAMCKLESVASNTTTGCEFHIRCKQFEHTIPDMQTIHQACASLWSKTYDYEIDGLIFTPMYSGVGGNKPNEANELNGKKFTWDASFKWKPPHYNTIDFLVEVQKDKDGQDLIRYIAHDGDNVMSKVIPYKTLILRVGFDKKRHKHMNAFHDVLYDNDDYFKDLIGTEHEGDYVAMPFVPTVPYEPEAYLCHIELEKDNTDALRMKTLEGDVFQEDSVVEFQYAKDDAKKQGPWKWIPLRVRQDKTQALREGKKSMNNYTTADTNWRSIHYPVTEDMILGSIPVPYVEVADTIYYNLTEKINSTTTALRDFHNMYVKRKLIEGVVGYLRHKMRISDVYLMDYAVGKAGDLSKWTHSQLRFVFGIDVHGDNITNAQDGACVRYLRWRHKNRKHPMRALFLEGNSGLNIRTQGSAFKSTMDKEIMRSLFGHGKAPNKKYVFEHGMAKEGFHISACMFALHYFFENTKTLHTFLKNLAECTRLHGYFVGTCFDGESVFKFLYKRENGTLIQKNESVRIDKNGRKMFEITKKYSATQSQFVADETSVGMPILVYQESIDKQFMEYLVNFEYFVRLMEDYGFVLVEKEELRSMGFHDASGLFNRLYGAMKREIEKEEELAFDYRDGPKMSTFEKTVSFLNRYFIFKKVRELSQTTLNQMETVIREKEEENAGDDAKGEDDEDMDDDDVDEENPQNANAKKGNAVEEAFDLKPDNAEDETVRIVAPKAKTEKKTANKTRRKKMGKMKMSLTQD